MKINNSHKSNFIQNRTKDNLRSDFLPFVPSDVYSKNDKKEDDLNLYSAPAINFKANGARVYTYGFDGYYTGSDLRNDIRTKIEMQCGLRDEDMRIKADLLPNDERNKCQLNNNSKYFKLGIPRFNQKSGKNHYPCLHLKDMSDNDGLRGKTPLSGKRIVLDWRLREIKSAGIDTIIDLRSEGECSPNAFKSMKKNGLRYYNFPIEDCTWSKDSLKQITGFIDEINKGDFYVGCANGQARTDLAVAMNYLLNANSHNVPVLYYCTPSTTRVSIRENMKQILSIIDENKDIVLDWGWNSYDEFIQEYVKRFENVLNTFSKI